MGMAAILVNGWQPFLQSFISLPQGGSKWNLSNIGPEAPVEKAFEILNIFFPYKWIRKQTWPYRKKVKCQCMTIILATLVDLLFPPPPPPPPTVSNDLCKDSAPRLLGSGEVEKKIFKAFYYIRAWRPSWSTDRNHFSNLSFPQPKEAPYEIWAKLAQGLQRRSRLKLLKDGRTDGRTDDGRKVITIAHLEQSSGELNMFTPVNPFFLYMTLGLPGSEWTC